MKKIILFTLTLLLTFSFVKAQGIECGTMANLENLKIQDPQLEYKLLQNEQALQTYIKTHSTIKSRKGTIITIPVVVHVVYANPSENISAAQVLSQIAILNKDYRKSNADTSAIPSVFAAVASAIFNLIASSSF